MKFKTLTPLLSMMFLATACVSGTATETVSVDNMVDFTGASVPIGLNQTVEQSVPVDVSNAVSKLNDVGTASLTIDQNTITGNISFLSHIKVALENPNMPDALVVCDTDVNTTSNVNDFPVVANSDQLLSYLSSSGNLHFWITGTIPAGHISLKSTILLSVSDKVSKSL